MHFVRHQSVINSFFEIICNYYCKARACAGWVALQLEFPAIHDNQLNKFWQNLKSKPIVMRTKSMLKLNLRLYLKSAG